jgi:hypothetical protein
MGWYSIITIQNTLDLLRRVGGKDAQFLAISYPNYHEAETLKFG